jgi:hypothetical protein
MRTAKSPALQARERAARVELRLPPHLVEQIEAYADTHHIERSLALRCLIEAGLAAEAQAMLEGRPADGAPAAASRRTGNVLALVSPANCGAA